MADYRGSTLVARSGGVERGNASLPADPFRDIAAPYPNTALALALDVTDRTQVAEAVRQAEARFGTVDVLVNNAGHGYRAAVEEADEGDVDELFATNFFGPVALIKAVLPGMRARRSGTIVNVSRSPAASHRRAPVTTPPQNLPWRGCRTRSARRSAP